jgi:CRISPR-associated protein Cmr5
MSQLINIEQIRAKNALAATSVKKRSDEGDNLSGYPSLIINNGLIATIAFSIHKEKQHQRIADAIARHLKDRKIVDANDAMALRDALCNSNATTLQRASHEALHFLSYLKRFQKG